MLLLTVVINFPSHFAELLSKEFVNKDLMNKLQLRHSYDDIVSLFATFNLEECKKFLDNEGKNGFKLPTK